MTPTESRVAKILGEVAEARREQAMALVRQFTENERIAVAEILADSHGGGKFDLAMKQLEPFASDGISAWNMSQIYRSLGLTPSGAERS